MPLEEVGIEISDPYLEKLLEEGKVVRQSGGATSNWIPVKVAPRRARGTRRRCHAGSGGLNPLPIINTASHGERLNDSCHVPRDVGKAPIQGYPINTRAECELSTGVHEKLTTYF
jgi:hypothetical protein